MNNEEKEMLITALLVLSVLIANFPFLTERFLGIVTLKKKIKPIALRGLELIIGYFLLGGIAYFLESQQGIFHSQHWQFYIATFCLYLVFAFPGMVSRYFWRKPGI